MVKKIGLICMMLLELLCGVSEAQVTPGTINSRTLDGVGNKIGSTVSGPDRGINVFCIGASCGSAGSTYLDADGIVNQTTSAVHGQNYMFNGATWDRVRGTIAAGLLVNVSNASLAVTGSLGRTWVLASGTDSVAAVQSGVWTVAATQSGVWSVGRTWTLASGTDSVTVGNAFLLDATFTGRFPVSYIDADAIANQTTTSMHGQLYGFNGATWDRLRATIANGLAVDVTRVQGTVTVAGNKTNNAAAPGATNIGALPCVANAANPAFTEGNQVACSVLLNGGKRTDLTTIASTVVVNGGLAGTLGTGGANANNTAITQNPNLIGVETIAQGSQPTAATAGNVRRALGTTEGSIFVTPYSSNRFSCFVQAVTVTTQCQAAPAAGLRAYVVSFSASNQVATVQTLDVIFGTGVNCATAPTALTHKWQFGTAAITTSPYDVSQTFPSPLIPTAANAICVRPSLATAFGATITGYIAP